MPQSSEASATCHEKPVEHARAVMKTIFASFVLTLPIFHTLSLLFIRKESRKPTRHDLYRKHGLAG